MNTPMQLPPDEIARDDLLDAIQAWDAGETHEFEDSTVYDVLYKGRRYPPKAIVGIAAQRVLGRQLSPHEFKGGEGTKAFHILEREGFEIVPKADDRRTRTPSKDWTDAELLETVKAYLRMRENERSGTPYNKAAVNRELRAGALAGRSQGSIEYRMQNISSVLAELGEYWIKGYKPATNVGVQTKQRLLRQLEELNGFEVPAEAPTFDPVKLEQRTRRLMQRGQIIKPTGREMPKRFYGETPQYERSPAVRAYVLIRAKGCCELCGNTAPFVTSEGLPYLEVHHIQPLAEGGADTVENAAALCPNCHRACHFASEKTLFALYLITRNRIS